MNFIYLKHKYIYLYNLFNSKKYSYYFIFTIIHFIEIIYNYIKTINKYNNKINRK